MLSSEVLAIIKQSVPILAKHGESITQNFYTLLFDHHPELKHIFNLSNQRNGNQARALADAIFAYANLAEQPALLKPMVNRIANKHVSLNIQPEHYPMVGEALLMALSEKLDIPMSHEIIQAWGKAYESLASMFIACELNLYQNSASKQGGWQGFRRFTINNIVNETPLIKSFYLTPKDGGELAQFQPGQYVGVKLGVPGHPYEEVRQYSLSDQPSQAHYRISVKAEPGDPGGIVSNYLHEQIHAGDTVLLSAPCGDFVLPTPVERDLVLISGGVGVTPMMSMLKSYLHTSNDKQVTFIHCSQNSEHHCFLNELNILRKHYDFKHYSAYTDEDGGDHQGFINQTALDKFLVGTDADYYFCGPFPFMIALRHLLLERGISEERIHYEVFGPTLSLAV